MQLLQKFTEFVKKENLFQTKDKLLLAVSGGVDSVVLCELCKQAGYDLAIAHCNFQLRGEESERDEQFVKELAKKHSVELFVKKFDTEKYAELKKLSIQVAARELRYEWFNQIVNGQWSMMNGENLETHNLQLATHILTAHHANDNIETLLMNFFKGTGISGMRGILPKHGKIIRPLLFAKKEELLEFAVDNALTYAEDSSNSSDKYTRNYFRNQLIPSIQKVFPQAVDNLVNSIERFRDIDLLYQQAIEVHKKQLIEKKGEEVHIPVLKLLKSAPLTTLIYEITKEYNFTSSQAEEVLKLLKSDSGKYILSSSHRILKNRKWLIISPNDTAIAENILIGENDKLTRFSKGLLKIEKLAAGNSQLSTNNSIANLDADEITFPLLLRKWKQGDYFYPLGMNKKKKLSRFFIDQKLSLTEKESVWVLEMNKKIVWIIGQRIDDRFKITGKTTNVLEISFN